MSTLAARALEPRASGRPVDGGIPSFDALYEQYFAFVWRSARRLGIVDSALEDVAQEVFLVVHRRLDSLERGASIRSWLFSIVVRVVSLSLIHISLGASCRNVVLDLASLGL